MWHAAAQSARRHTTHRYGYEGTELGQVNLTDETVLFIRDDVRSPDENQTQQREHLTERQETT